MTLKNDHNFHAQSGLSLVELLVVIVIIVILATFALMQRGSANEQFQRQNVSRELKVAFERARFDSVKRRAECANRAKVIVDTNSFTLWTDTDLDGTPESGESITTTAPANIVISHHSGVSLPVTLYFNKRGDIDPRDASDTVIDPAFYACNNSCAVPANDNANLILVTQTGTVNLLSGTATIPSFGVSGGTAVNASIEINDNLLLPSASVTSCP
jgi:prepilin-type N-terminal cleavage/methylation domain-containing protein